MIAPNTEGLHSNSKTTDQSDEPELSLEHGYETASLQSDVVFSRIMEIINTCPEASQNFTMRLVKRGGIDNMENKTREDLFAALEARFHDQSSVHSFYQKMIEYIQHLIKTDAVDEESAKMYVAAFPQLHVIASALYERLASTNEHLSWTAAKEKNLSYAAEIQSWQTSLPQERSMVRNGWVHMYAKKQHGSSTGRLYISVKLNGAPDQVVRAWREALHAAGAQDDVYCKMHTELDSGRFDSIVVYLNEQNSNEQMESILNEFFRRCKQEWLTDRVLPTAVDIAPGVAYAVEPDKINYLRRAMKEESLSYNELVSAVIKLSFERAFQEIIKTDSPRTVQEAQQRAREYFPQFLLLCGIDPKTMLSKGNKAPSWVRKYRLAGV